CSRLERHVLDPEARPPTGRSTPRRGVRGRLGPSVHRRAHPSRAPMERIRGRPRLTGMGENEHHSGESTRREARPQLSGQPSLAACGNGLFRAADAAGRTALARAVASGTAIRLAAGICVDAETWDEAHWPERRRLRCLAQATANPELVLTGISAARVHGLQLL